MKSCCFLPCWRSGSSAPVRLLFIRCLICRMYRISYKSTEEKKKEQSCCVRIGFKGCMHSGKGNSNTGSIPLLPQCNSKVSSNTIDWVVNSQQILVFRGKNTINVKFTLTFDFWLLTFDFTLYTLHSHIHDRQRTVQIRIRKHPRPSRAESNHDEKTKNQSLRKSINTRATVCAPLMLFSSH